MVFQNFRPISSPEPQKNAEFGLEIRGVEKAERYKIAHDSLKQVGLEGWEDAYPNQLSGGMQLVCLAARCVIRHRTGEMDEAFLTSSSPTPE